MSLINNEKELRLKVRLHKTICRADTYAILRDSCHIWNICRERQIAVCKKCIRCTYAISKKKTNMSKNNSKAKLRVVIVATKVMYIIIEKFPIDPLHVTSQPGDVYIWRTSKRHM